MHVIFDTRPIQDHFPGIARYAYNLLAALPAHLRPDETLTALHDPSAPNAHYDLAALAAIGIYMVDYRVPIFGLRNMFSALPITQHSPASIYHSPYYLRPYRVSQPSVTTIYDVISFVYPQFVPSLSARILIRVFHALAIRASRAIIAVSRSAADDMARFFPSARRKIVVVPGAPDAVFAPQPQRRREAVRAKYNLPEHFALFLASNKPHKNLARLIQAWAIVCGDEGLAHHTPVLVIAGHQDPRYPHAQAQARDLGLSQNVRFVGDVSDEDAAALYSTCEVFAFPSLYEGFGLPPLEAMACGAPVACANTSSLPEVVGDAALLFDPLDIGAIATTIQRIRSSPQLRADLRQRGLERAAQFTWDRVAEKTIDVYRALARRP